MWFYRDKGFGPPGYEGAAFGCLQLLGLEQHLYRGLFLLQGAYAAPYWVRPVVHLVQ